MSAPADKPGSDQPPEGGSELESLLEKCLPGLRAFVRLRTGDQLGAKETCSDVVQSVCREVLEHKEKFRYGGEEGFRRWLYTAAMRKIGHKHRFYRAEKRDVGRERVPITSSTATDEEARELLSAYHSFITPSRHAMAREELTRIETAFGKLSPLQQEVVVQARVMGLPHAEIAKNLGKTEGNVRVILFRALAELADWVQRDEGGAASSESTPRP